MRVVAGRATVEPENLVDAEVVVEGLLDLLARDAGVALLDLGEEALLGGEEDSGSVGVDGAAFEDEAVGFAVFADDLGAELFHRVELGDVVRDLVVAAPVVVLGPGVEVPVGDGDLALWSLMKMGPESRSQTRSVCQGWKCRRAILAPERRRMRWARFSAASSLTRMWTSSQQER